MSKRACVPGAAFVPSSSFQRFWRKIGARAVGFGCLLATLLFIGAGVAWAQNDVISEINVTGNRRIPAETIKARIFSKAGDVYDQAALERDFNSLWNTGYFEDIKFLREQTPKGWRIIVQVKERPTIRAPIFRQNRWNEEDGANAASGTQARFDTARFSE